MRIAAITSITIGLLGALMAALTALEVAPAFIGGAFIVGDTVSTTAFWGGLAVLVLLAGIAFGVISGGHLGSTEG